MGIFSKIKNAFKKEEIEKTKEEDKKEIELYTEGLSKTRDNFVNRLINLNNKTKKITDEYFEELEDILIMADIGVNTVLNFIDRLKERVKHENITDLSYLQSKWSYGNFVCRCKWCWKNYNNWKSC